MEHYAPKISNDSNPQGIKYNLGNGKFTDSKKEFQPYLKKESKFYQRLSEAKLHPYEIQRKPPLSSKSSDLSSLFA